MRRQIHFAPPAVGQAANELSGVQEAGAQNHFHLQFAAQAQAAVHLGREKGRVHRAQKDQQGRIRAAMKLIEGLQDGRVVLLAKLPFNLKGCVGFEFIFDAGCQKE